MKRILSVVLLGAGVATVGIAFAGNQAQAHSHDTQPQTNADKIANAMTAAPDFISAQATILDWTDQAPNWPVLREGDNGWSCFPDFPSSPTNDPWCMDGVSLEWLNAYATGQEPKITTPGLSYMLQGGSDASNDDPFATEPKPGQDWVVAPPHLMVFSPTKLDPAAYADHHTGRPSIMFGGTPYEHLMIPVAGGGHH